MYVYIYNDLLAQDAIECIVKLSSELLPEFDPDDVKDDVEAEV